jgi:hypothetical protein
MSLAVGSGSLGGYLSIYGHTEPGESTLATSGASAPQDEQERAILAAAFDIRFDRAGRELLWGFGIAVIACVILWLRQPTNPELAALTLVDGHLGIGVVHKAVLDRVGGNVFVGWGLRKLSDPFDDATFEAGLDSLWFLPAKALYSKEEIRIRRTNLVCAYSANLTKFARSLDEIRRQCEPFRQRVVDNLEAEALALRGDEPKAPETRDGGQGGAPP